jgi:site-specific DNA-adenine methylase
MQYPGGKTREARIINSFVPTTTKHYVEPFAGGLSVMRYMLEQGRTFDAITVNDLDPSVYRFWSSVKDGSFYPRWRELYNRMVPTRCHEQEIRDHFERCKDDWVNDGDVLAWFFLRCFAVGQRVLPPHIRKGVAAFNNMFLQSGLCREKPVKWRRWEAVFRSINVINTNVSMLMETLKEDGQETTIYLDPPYPIIRSEQLYEYEMTKDEHIHVRDSLRETTCTFLLSVPKTAIFEELYVDDDYFDCIPVPVVHKDQIGRGKARGSEWLIRRNT